MKVTARSEYCMTITEGLLTLYWLARRTDNSLLDQTNPFLPERLSRSSTTMPNNPSTLDIEAHRAAITRYNDDYRPFDNDEDFAPRDKPRDKVSCDEDNMWGDVIRNVVFCDCYSCCLGQSWCDSLSWCCWHSSML